MSTTQLSINEPTIQVAFAEGTTVQTAVDAPIVDVSILTPTIQIEIGGSVPGATGPQGPTGPAGGSVQTYPAGEVLSTGRVVIIESGAAYYFQHTNPAHHFRAYGITKTSASSIGVDVDVQLSGEITDAAFTFTANNVLFVGANGVIFDGVQSGGVIVQAAGVAAEDRRMRIDFSHSIKID